MVEKDKWPKTSFDHINNFEKELTDDNYILIKFFLHISEKCQQENLVQNYRTLGKAWREISSAYDESNNYKMFLDRHEKNAGSNRYSQCSLASYCCGLSE